MIHVIQTLAELDAQIIQSQSIPTFIFKHSTRCGTSRNAHARVQQFIETITQEGHSFHLVMVRVIEEREISNEISRRFSIIHQSPQILLIRNGQLVWHASHQQIDPAQMRLALLGKL
ncbi:bacillithiol system redox-active protein YtxJ [Paenibacillus sp. GSMTC-2017]|uniref:bacillithiol system redox-active protein YtxJ n=1 Tax=Paenibacillus sp. GSMTC-2017 TaxID=2794350 RepID=UPI0018D662B4|nr:bacillithiol system redox-active protein YtxJ [Paenibacillus sp. GSMTC-2017]MBH5319841.1 bacillithiol system redox-active protein YtxJ [Paenibacillus sp. GSMTC-2017]